MIAKIIIFNNLKPFGFTVYKRCYAKIAAAGGAKGLGKKAGKIGPTVEKKIIPVVTDPARLVNYCCGSNYFVEGEDVKIKPDSEYPEWLWSVYTGKPKKLEELDPNTKEYWRKLRTLGLNRNNVMSKIKKF